MNKPQLLLNIGAHVYFPREDHITPFSGDVENNGRSVDNFIEEIERVLCARNQSANDQYDFVMSLLKGAKEICKR